MISSFRILLTNDMLYESDKKDNLPPSKFQMCKYFPRSSRASNCEPNTVRYARLLPKGFATRNTCAKVKTKTLSTTGVDGPLYREDT